MKKIAVTDIDDATYFSDSTFLDSGFVLTSPEVAVSQKLRNRLVKWGFRNIYTEGEPVSQPPALGGDDAAVPGETTQSLEDEQDRDDASGFFAETVIALEETFEQYRTTEELRLAALTELVKQIIAELRENKRYMLSLDDSMSPAKNYLATHSVKTAVLAVALADFLKFPAFKQVDLGLAGLMHEIGLLKIPQELYLSDKTLGEQERRTLAAHPVLGFRILKSAGFPVNACLAVLEHNERMDGTGQPRRLKSEQISEYGRVLAVATSYNAATSQRPYRPGIDGHSGVMDLMKDAGTLYDEKVIAALLYTLSLYPIGTYVRMSNGAVGIVVQANDDDPKHPLIKLIIDENGNRYSDQPTVQTREGDEVTIQTSLSRDDLVSITSGR